MNDVGVAGLLMMEVYRRLRVGIFGSRATPQDLAIGRAAWNEACFAIDAPDIVPAGSMVREPIQGYDDECEYVPMPRYWHREPTDGATDERV